MVLCFWICNDNVRVTHRPFSCGGVLTQGQGLCFSLTSHQQGGLGRTRNWEASQPGQLSPTDQRNILYQHSIMLSSETAGIWLVFHSACFCFVHSCCVWLFLFGFFFCYCCSSFALLLIVASSLMKCLYLSSHVF